MALLGLCTPLVVFTFLGTRNVKVSNEFQPHKDGWWELTPGVYGKWCKDKEQCPSIKTPYDNNWRLLVWCKSNSCGDIHATINIYKNKYIVGNSSVSAIANHGDKVILTFSSDLGGEARLVRFSTLGGTKNTFPVITGSS